MILVDKESSLQVSVPEEKGRVIIDYLRTDGYGNSSFETPLRESITLYGTVGTGFVVPQNLNISSYYDLINAEYGKRVYLNQVQSGCDIIIVLNISQIVW